MGKLYSSLKSALNSVDGRKHAAPYLFLICASLAAGVACYQGVKREFALKKESDRQVYQSKLSNLVHEFGVVGRTDIDMVPLSMWEMAKVADSCNSAKALIGAADSEARSKYALLFKTIKNECIGYGRAAPLGKLTNFAFFKSSNLIVQAFMEDDNREENLKQAAKEKNAVSALATIAEWK